MIAFGLIGRPFSAQVLEATGNPYPFHNSCVHNAASNGGLRFGPVALKSVQLATDPRDPARPVDAAKLTFYADDGTMDTMQRCFTWGNSENALEIPEGSMVSATALRQGTLQSPWTDETNALVQVLRRCGEKTCYSWDSLTCADQFLVEQKGEYKVTVELPLAAFKPGLCHPHMYENLLDRLSNLDNWNGHISGVFGPQLIPDILRVPLSLDTKLVVESLPVSPTAMVEGSMFQGDRGVLTSNAFWLMNLYLATIFSVSTPSSALSTVQHNWSAAKLKKAQIHVLRAVLQEEPVEGLHYVVVAAQVSDAEHGFLRAPDGLHFLSVPSGGDRC